MPMTSDAVELARSTARFLDAQQESGMEAGVERVLAARDSEIAPPQFESVTVAVAALLVSVANLAWQIYRDLSTDRENAKDAGARAAIARRIRNSTELPPRVSPAQRDRLIEAVLEELNRSA